MLYSNQHVPCVSLGQNHILNRNKDASTLVQHVLGDVLNHKTDNGSLNRWKSVLSKSMAKQQSEPYARAVKLFANLMQRHQKFDYHRPLQRYCPLLDTKDLSSQDVNTVLAHLFTKGYSSHAQVTSFILCILSLVVTSEMWGGVHNENVVLQELVTQYISLRRNENLISKSLLQGIKVTGFH